MRICLYAYSFLPILGGAENAAEGLAGAWVRTGNDVLVVTDTPAPPDYDRKFPFPVVRRPRARDWRDLLSKRDVILCTGPNFRYFAEWLASGLPIGFRIESINAQMEKQTVEERLGLDPNDWRWAHRSGDFQICASNYLKRQLGDATIHVVHNGVPPIFRPLPDVRRGQHFLFYGRLVLEKGLDTLVDAVDICRGRGVEIPVKVVGSGPYRDRLVRAVEGRRLGDLLHVEAPIKGEALVRTINEARAVLAPSHWGETWGLVVSESLACGKCVIASSDGGIPEAAGEAALLFPPRDANALAEHMLRVARDTELVEKFEKRALVRAEHFSVERMAAEHLAILRDAVASHRGRRRTMFGELTPRRALLIAIFAFVRAVRRQPVPRGFRAVASNPTHGRVSP